MLFLLMLLGVFFHVVFRILLIIILKAKNKFTLFGTEYIYTHSPLKQMKYYNKFPALARATDNSKTLLDHIYTNEE